MLEKSLVVVPGLGRRAVGQSRQIFFIFDRLRLFPAPLRRLSEQREIETLDGLAAFKRELGADSPFLFHASDFMASGASEVTHPLLTLFPQARIVHESSIRIRRWLLLLLRNQVS